MTLGVFISFGSLVSDFLLHFKLNNIMCIFMEIGYSSCMFSTFLLSIKQLLLHLGTLTKNFIDLLCSFVVHLGMNDDFLCSIVTMQL